MNQKPGWQTSEFWITVGANIIGILALTGVIDPSDSAEVTGNFTEAVGGIFAVIANIAYVWSRTRVKQAPVPDPLVPPTTPDPPSE